MSSAVPRETARERISRENQQKVLRRRAEARYLSTLSADLDLQRLAELQVEVKLEAEQRAADALLVQHRPTRRVDAEVSAVESESLRVLRRFDIDARHMAVTHGGATLWCATADGSIAVRSGVAAEVTYVIPAEAEAGSITNLRATATHVWAGYSSGLVRVFDHCAFVHITEGSFHTGAVVCFSPIVLPSDRDVGGQMLSAGQDGCIVKWDSESRGFAAMFKIDLQIPSGIQCLCTNGQLMYAGSADGFITAAHVVTSEVLEVVAAHTEGISALACSRSGFVFSASAGCQLRVWRGAELVACHPTTSPILTIVVDEANDRVWTGEQDGTVRIWLATEADNFAVEKSLPPLGAPVLHLHAETALDAVKIWSLGSTGCNKMWYSSTNRSERSITNTVAVLKAIATQDGVELDKWRETVAKLHHVNERRKLQLARILVAQQDESIRRRYLWIWRMYLLRIVSRRRNVAVSKRLETDILIHLQRRYFTSWFEWFHAHQKRRLKATYSRLLLSHANMSSVYQHFAKMQTFVRLMKAAKKRRDLVNVLGLQSQRTQLRDVMRKWLKFTRSRQLAARKIAFVGALMRASDVNLNRLYYTKWRGFTQRREAKRQRGDVAAVLLTMTAAARRRFAYIQWHRFVFRKKTVQRKRAVAAALVATSDRGLISLHFKKWVAYRFWKGATLSSERKLAAEQDLAMVQKRYSELGALVEEKRRLDAQEAEIAKQEEELQQQDVELMRLRQQLADLEADIASASIKARATQQSLAEQFATVIAQLKAQVLNFHQDAVLVAQIRDKVKTVPVTKLFLEAHQQVKRAVVEVTGKAHIGTDEPWPLTQTKLNAMPAHQLSAILQAIKSMIVAFDLMDRPTRDSLQTDKEIVLNGNWLLQMAGRANDYRRRTLGRGALRAK